MKHWIRDWAEKARKEKINFKLMAFVHDETQCEVIGGRDMAEHLVDIQSKSMVYIGEQLGVSCPLETESAIGMNWADCH